MEKKPKYTPFPKIRNPATGKLCVDIDAVKELYLNGDEITWKRFAEKQGYRTNVSRESRGDKSWYAEVNLDEWKSEWLQRQCKVQDDEVVPALLKARRLVNENRASFILDWNSRAMTMKKMLDFALNVHIEDMKWDIQNTLKIQAGQAQRRCKLDAAEMATIASAAQRILDIEAKSLMLLPVSFKEVERKELEGDDAPPEMEVHTMGQAGMHPNEIVGLMASYFDQFEAKPKAIEVKGESKDPKKDSG